MTHRYTILPQLIPQWADIEKNLQSKNEKRQYYTHVSIKRARRSGHFRHEQSPVGGGAEIGFTRGGGDERSTRSAARHSGARKGII